MFASFQHACYILSAQSGCSNNVIWAMLLSSCKLIWKVKSPLNESLWNIFTWSYNHIIIWCLISSYGISFIVLSDTDLIVVAYNLLLHYQIQSHFRCRDERILERLQNHNPYCLDVAVVHLYLSKNEKI